MAKLLVFIVPGINFKLHLPKMSEESNQNPAVDAGSFNDYAIVDAWKEIMSGYKKVHDEYPGLKEEKDDEHQPQEAEDQAQDNGAAPSGEIAEPEAVN